MPSGSAAFFIIWPSGGSIARSHRNSFISGKETRISEWKTLKVMKRLLRSSCSSFTMLCQWMSFLIWVALLFFEIDKQKSPIHIFTETTKGKIIRYLTTTITCSYIKILGPWIWFPLDLRLCWDLGMSCITSSAGLTQRVLILHSVIQSFDFIDMYAVNFRSNLWNTLSWRSAFFFSVLLQT